MYSEHPQLERKIDRTVVKLIREVLSKTTVKICFDEENGIDTKMGMEVRYGVGGGTTN